VICIIYPVTGRARQGLGSFANLRFWIGAAFRWTAFFVRAGCRWYLHTYLSCAGPLIEVHFSAIACGTNANYLRGSTVHCPYYCQFQEDVGLQTREHSGVQPSDEIRSGSDLAASHRRRSTSFTLCASRHKGRKRPSSRPILPCSVSAHVQKRRPK
jgi:hypothetical protein